VSCHTISDEGKSFINLTPGQARTHCGSTHSRPKNQNYFIILSIHFNEENGSLSLISISVIFGSDDVHKTMLIRLFFFGNKQEIYTYPQTQSLCEH
jgi:hypothetical protein